MKRVRASGGIPFPPHPDGQKINLRNAKKAQTLSYISTKNYIISAYLLLRLLSRILLESIIYEAEELHTIRTLGMLIK